MSPVRVVPRMQVLVAVETEGLEWLASILEKRGNHQGWYEDNEQSTSQNGCHVSCRIVSSIFGRKSPGVSNSGLKREDGGRGTYIKCRLICFGFSVIGWLSVEGFVSLAVSSLPELFCSSSPSFALGDVIEGEVKNIAYLLCRRICLVQLGVGKIVLPLSARLFCVIYGVCVCVCMCVCACVCVYVCVCVCCVCWKREAAGW